jgi:hypothetical protein
MYISIDRDKTKFMHKHESFRTVCDLDYIGQVIKKTDVEPITDGTHFLPHWTELELQLLYKRSTGQTVCPHAGSVLRAVLLEMAQRLVTADMDADPVEADAQAKWIEDHLAIETEHADFDPTGYQYVRGSKTPGRKSSLFAHTACAILPPEEAAKVAHARITAQATRASALAHAQASATAVQAVSAPAQPKPVRSSAGAPRSGVCKAIWEALDAQVKLANGIVPERSFIKRLAEEKGWNSSTASVQYAAWRKQLSTT